MTPSILVFGAVPRIQLPDSRTMPPSQRQRLEAVRSACKEMETITAQRRISTALKHRHQQKPFPPFQFGDQVRIWREDLNRLAGTYTVLGYDNEKTSIVRLIPAGNSRPNPITNQQQSNLDPSVISKLEELQKKF